MISAINAAKLFIQLGTIQAESDSGDGVTNLRVNKLLYFAQGYSLAKYGVPLFDEEIEAWDLGPVVPSVYHAYKGFKKNVIEDSAPSRDEFSDTEFSLLIDVYESAKTLSTSRLVDICHEKDSPWYNVYHGVKMGGEIPRESIRAYFISHPFCTGQFTNAVKKLKEKAYTPKRDDNGVPVIPKGLAYGWSN